MVKGLVLAAMVIAAAEGVAYACSCAMTDDPKQLREWADDAAKNASALVEAEALTNYRQSPTGEEMTVLRTLAGTAPAKFRIMRTNFPSSASCDIAYEPGQRDVMLLYPTPWTKGGLPVLRSSGLCTDMLLDKPEFRQMVVERIGGPQRGVERG